MAHNSDFTRIGLRSADLSAGDPGLTLSEIATALGRSALDEGQLCGDLKRNQADTGWESAGATNEAAKYKPVRKQNMKVQQGDWWMADDGKCGLNILTSQSLQYFVSAMIAECKTGGVIDYTARPYPWSYLPPRGESGNGINPDGNDEWFRQLDFNGYNTEATFTKPRLDTNKTLQVNSGVIEDNNLYTIDFPASVTYADGVTLAQESLGLSDIRPGGILGSALGTYYMGIIFVDCGDTNVWVVGTASSTLSSFVSGWAGMTVSGASGLTGTVANKEIAMIPFISSVVVSNFNSGSGNTVSGLFMSSYGTGPTKAWIHRFGYVDLSMTLSNISWVGNTTAGNLLGTIYLEVISGPNHQSDFPLNNVSVGIQRLINGSYVDLDGVGFNLTSVTMYHGTDEPATGSITLIVGSNPNQPCIYISDDDTPEFVYGGTYRLTMDVRPSVASENTPATPSTVYSNSFVIGS